MAGRTSFKTSVINSPKRCKITFSKKDDQILLTEIVANNPYVDVCAKSLVKTINKSKTIWNWCYFCLNCVGISLNLSRLSRCRFLKFYNKCPKLLRVVYFIINYFWKSWCWSAKSSLENAESFLGCTLMYLLRIYWGFSVVEPVLENHLS